MKQDIENIIKKNIEKLFINILPCCNVCECENGKKIWCSCHRKQINDVISPSLLADEVLKVVVEKIKEEKEFAVKQLAYETDVEVVEYLKGKENLSNDLLNLLTNSSTLDGEQSEHLSPNKENE